MCAFDLATRVLSRHFRTVPHCQNGAVAALPDRDLVWNRAAMDAGGQSPLEGDLALAGLLLFHNLAMNGGVLHAIECLGADELEQAVGGFRFFALDEPASFLSEVSARWQASDHGPEVADQMEGEFDQLYGALVPDDETVFAAFSERFEANPSAFAPLDPNVP